MIWFDWKGTWKYAPSSIWKKKLNYFFFNYNCQTYFTIKCCSLWLISFPKGAIFYHFNSFFYLSWISNWFQPTKFTWNIGVPLKWILCETRYSCNSREIFHMNFTWNQFLEKFTWTFQVKFTGNKFHVENSGEYHVKLVSRKFTRGDFACYMSVDNCKVNGI